MEQINSVLASVPKLVEDSNKAAKPNVTCSSDDYTKAVNVDIVFMQSLANKFCNGTSDSATLTNKDLGSTAYDGYSFQFDYTAWDDCTANCTEAYKAAISACMFYMPILACSITNSERLQAKD